MTVTQLAAVENSTSNANHARVFTAPKCSPIAYYAEIGESRGGAYVTMESINSARKAIVALDASDVGGRQVQVRFFVEMNPKRRNLETMNSSPRSVGPKT
ncbi:hypothetical protein JHK82_050057 [Glycine max]|nr:hypothetical protein JHK86_049930 [Glycine max]KAG4935783.1 hypothetical protein JHK85_050702 [Glycine max]KAG5091279.1 hypothetical protein JHK82_050057 [Glycine max]